VIVDEARHPKCRRGVIGCNGQQQSVNFAGKAGAIARRRNQTALAIKTDGNDNTATSLRAIADARNDFRARQTGVLGDIRLQPVQKRWPCVSAHDFDCGATIGIAQMNEGEVDVQ
jgi:hypothetical protein